MSSHSKFRWLLPLLAFGITFAALAVPASVLYQRLRLASQNGSGVTFRSKQLRFDIPRQELGHFTLVTTTRWEEKPITAMHVPGLFGEVLVSLPTTWPQSWHPEGFPLLGWRSISMPVFCLPFWWFVGFGIDRLLAQTRTHWAVLALGTLLSGFMFFVAVGLTVLIFSEHHSSIALQIGGCYLWGVLFGVFPLLWYRQRRWPTGPVEPKKLSSPLHA